MSAREFLAVVRHPLTYRRGRRECFDSFGMTYGCPDSLRSVAYDRGRSAGDRS